MDRMKQLVLTGSDDLEPLLGMEPLNEADRRNFLRQATEIRRELQRFSADQLAVTMPTCASCRHARKAMNPAVVACGREHHAFESNTSSGPLGTLPNATGWGRPGTRLNDTHNSAVIRSGMSLMQLLDHCDAHARVEVGSVREPVRTRLH